MVGNVVYDYGSKVKGDPLCSAGSQSKRQKYHIYRVVFSKGPTQKSSKYGIGPTQQDKMAKYTGPTQSYQRRRSKE